MSAYAGGNDGSLFGTGGIAGILSVASGCGCDTGKSSGTSVGEPGPESNSMLSCDGGTVMVASESSNDGAIELDNGVAMPDGMLMPWSYRSGPSHSVYRPPNACRWAISSSSESGYFKCEDEDDTGIGASAAAVEVESVWLLIGDMPAGRTRKSTPVRASN